MFKRLLGIALLVGTLAISAGCSDYFYRGKNYVEWHVKGAYNDLVDMHRWIDRHVFNQDIYNPNDY